MTKEKWMEMCEKIAPHMDAIQEIRNEYLGKDDAMALLVTNRLCSVTHYDYDCTAYREQPYRVENGGDEYATISRKKAPAPTKATGAEK